MRRVLLPTLASLLVVAAVPVAPGPAGAVTFNAAWEASSGARPDSVCPPWRPAVSGAEPALAGGALHIQTGACTANASYWHSGADIAMPDTVVVEARLRFFSGGECVGPCGHYRAGANLSITVAPNTGTLFHVGSNEIFLTNGECAGITSAAVPTTDAAHTYRVVVHAGVVRVYRDGVLTLTGGTYTSASDHGGTPRVGWGEASSLAYGTSDWEYVKHNAHATGCATTGVVDGGPGGGGAGAFGVRAWPNPASGVTRIAWTAAKTARVRVEIFDASGRLVRRLCDAEMAPGPREVAWDGRDRNGRALSPGHYLCRVKSDEGVGVQRIVRAR
jgi:hypothetical protein